jgi:hypothetical protein
MKLQAVLVLLLTLNVDVYVSNALQSTHVVGSTLPGCRISASATGIYKNNDNYKDTTNKSQYQIPKFLVSRTRTTLFAQLPRSSAKITIPQESSIWETLAGGIINTNDNPLLLTQYMQTLSILRVVVPAAGSALIANLIYPTIAMALADWINDAGVFAVVSQDASQFIQNILTTSGLTFSILTGQTYYFLYQQQEAIYIALFDEVAVAKSLLEQVSLVAQGRESLYRRILECIDRYVKEDLIRFNDSDPAVLLSSRPVDDPLEDILYLTSVGEPSIVYQTVKTLRTARAYRLGALQRKLPPLHMILLWTLAGIVLFTFPLLGAGSQTIGGMAILRVQAWYLSFIVFGIWLTLGVVTELQRTGQNGAYNARAVLSVMVAGLEEELDLRLQGKIGMAAYFEPTVDTTSGFESYDNENY